MCDELRTLSVEGKKGSLLCTAFGVALKRSEPRALYDLLRDVIRHFTRDVMKPMSKPTHLRVVRTKTDQTQNGNFAFSIAGSIPYPKTSPRALANSYGHDRHRKQEFNQ